MNNSQHDTTTGEGETGASPVEQFQAAGRGTWVDSIVDRVAAMETGEASGPLLISLESRPGYGKTRIIQEAYRRIAEPQRYWPSSLVPPDANSARAGRKVVGFGTRAGGGVFHVPAGERPPWLWSGIVCGRSASNVKESALRDAVDQIRPHFEPLFEARELGREALGGVREIAEAGLDAAGVLTLGPVVALGRGALKTTYALWNRDRVRRRQLSDRDIDADAEAATRALKHIEAVAAKAIPIVIAVEDAHDADPTLLEFLSLILERELPVLIVCASWVEATLEQRQAANAGDPTQTFGQLLIDLETHAPDRLTRVSIEPLGDDVVHAMIRRQAPHTAPGTLDRLVRLVAGNPYSLMLLWDLDAVRGSIVEGALQLDASDIDALPHGIDDALRRRFTELDPSWRMALGLAALQGQIALPELVAVSAEAVESDADEIAEALRRAVDASAGIRPEGPGVRFIEAYDRSLAREHLGLALRATVVERGQRAVVERIIAERGAPQWDDLDREWQRLALGVHITIAQESGVVRGDGDVAISALRLAELQRADPAAALAALAVALDRSVSEDPLVETRPVSDHALELLVGLAPTLTGLALSVARDHVRGLADAGDDDRLPRARLALAECLLLVRRSAEVCDVLATEQPVGGARLKRSAVDRLAIGRLTAETRRVAGDEAVRTLLERLDVALSKRNATGMLVAVREIDVEHGSADRSLRPRRRLAYALGDDGRWNEALTIWRELVDAEPRPQHRREAMFGKAHALGQLGRWAEAIATWEALLKADAANHDRARDLEGLGFALCGARRWSEALARLKESQELEGKPGGEILVAFAAAGAGDWDEAIPRWGDLFRSTPQLARRGVGRLAALLVEDERSDELLAFLEALREREAQGDGSAVALAQIDGLEIAGRYDEALDKLDALEHTDRSRGRRTAARRTRLLELAERHDELVECLRQDLVLRQEDPGAAWTIRAQLARVLVKAGRAQDGTALFEELIAEAGGITGALSLTRSLAAVLEHQGYLAEARDVWLHVLPEAEDPLDRAWIYQQIASLYNKERRNDDALDAWGAMLELAGSDRNLRNEALNGLGFTLGLLRRPDEAVDLWSELLEHSTDVEDSFQAGFGLGSALGAMGRYEDAVDALRGALVDADEPQEVTKTVRALSWVVEQAEDDEARKALVEQATHESGLSRAAAFQVRQAVSRLLVRIGEARAALELWPSDTEPGDAALERALALRGIGQLDEALRMVRRTALENRASDRVDAWATLASLSRSVGDEKSEAEAWHQAEEACATHERLLEIRVHRANDICASGDWATGIGMMESIVPEVGGWLLAMAQRTLLYGYSELSLWEKEVALAQDLRDRALAEGDASSALFQSRTLAVGLERLERWEDAQCTWLEALSYAVTDSETADVVEGLGRTFEESGQLDEGIRTITALALPDSPLVAYSRARALSYLFSKLEDWTQCRSWWQRAFEDAPQHSARVEALRGGAWAAGAQNDWNSAAAAWEQLLTLALTDDERSIAVHGLIWVWRHDPDRTPVDWSSALDALLACGFDDASVHLAAVGEALYDAGRFDETVGLLERFAEGPTAGTRVQECLLLLACALWETGDRARSGTLIRQLERDSETDPAVRHRVRLANLMAGPTPISCRVVAVDGPGFRCSWGEPGLLFLPQSQVNLDGRLEDPDAWVGQDVEVLVVEINAPGRDVAAVVSRRVLLQQELASAFRPGDRIDATVTEVRSFGLFVDLGEGLLSLVHKSELAHGYVTDPADIAAPGDTLEVEVIDVNADDGRVRLSRKRCVDDPFLAIAAKCAVGDEVTGTVSNIVDFGVFVDLGGADALLHRSEVMPVPTSTEALDGRFRQGQPVRVWINSIDPTRRRISLTMRHAEH